jgi:hypothetical protein
LFIVEQIVGFIVGFIAMHLGMKLVELAVKSFRTLKIEVYDRIGSAGFCFLSWLIIPIFLVWYLIQIPYTIYRGFSEAVYLFIEMLTDFVYN